MSELEQLRQEAEQLRNQIRVSPAFVVSPEGIYHDYADTCVLSNRMPGKRAEIQP